MDTLLKDTSYAFRMLRKQPGFTAVAVIALAFGIGVNTAVFTALNAVAMRPLQAKNPAQMVTLYATGAEERWGTQFSLPDYAYFREHNSVFSDIVASSREWLTLSDSPTAPGPVASGLSTIAGFRFPSKVTSGVEFLSAGIVTENYFSVLGVEAFRGRTFRPGEDDAVNAAPVVMISANYWQRRFNGDPDLLGKTIKLNNVSFTVVGITPKDFLGTNQNVPDVWLPISQLSLADHGVDWSKNREDACCLLTARLKPGVTTQQAQSQLSVLQDQVRQLHAQDSKYRKSSSITLWRANALAVHPDPQVYPIVALLMGAVGLVLLIACANVANLQLARSAARQREIGVRLAIGASRARVIQQLLTESCLLGIIAGVLGLLMSWWLLTLLVNAVAASLPAEWGILALEVHPDLRIFVFTLLISCMAGVGFGLAPALQTSNPNLVSVLKEDGWGLGVVVARGWLRSCLIAGQVAISLLLLICAGLLVRGSMRSLRVDPGFETRHIIRLEPELAGGTQYSPEKRSEIAAELTRHIGALADVESITRGHPPLSGGWRTARVALDGHWLVDVEHAPRTGYAYVSANYFDTLSIPLVRGRDFSEQEVRANAPVAIVSEATARMLWPGHEALGRRVTLDAVERFDGEKWPNALEVEVIGVAKDIRSLMLSEVDSSKVYLPLSPNQWSNIVIRTEHDPSSVMSRLGTEVQAVDPNLVAYAETLDGAVTSNPAFVFSRIGAIFATCVGLLGLSLASIGIYGMVSFAVVQRTHEIGVRMALGARVQDVLSLIVGQSMGPVIIGMGTGLIAAAAGARLLRSFLFGLSPADPLAFVGISMFLGSIAALASFLPARRASQVDPIVALRYE